MTIPPNKFSLVALEPDKKPSAEERQAVLRKARKSLRTAQAKREMPGEVLALIESGSPRPVYGAGLLVNHIVYGFFTPVTLCRRILTGPTSSEMIATPLGFICRRCIRIWNTAMDARNTSIKVSNDRILSESRGSDVVR